MSETAAPPADPPVTQVTTQVTTTSPGAPVWHQLLDTQFLIAVAMIALVYVILIATIRFGSTELQAQVLSLGNTIIGGLMGFFFGAAVTKATMSTAPAAPPPKP